MAEEKKNPRNPIAEVVRYIGAFGIVWFHLDGPQAWIGHAALEVFIMISVFFALQSGQAWSRKRVLRIWLFWSAVYGVMKILQALVQDTSVADEFSWSMILTGPSLPLWFLPFIYVATGLAVLYANHITWHPVVEGLALGIVAAGLASVSPTLPVPLAQWALGSAAMTGAILLYRASQGHWIALAIWTVPILIVMEELLILAVPIAMVALFVTVKTPAQWPHQAGRLALPIYVLHSGVASASGLHGSAAEITAVVVICTILGAVLVRTPVFRSYL